MGVGRCYDPILQSSMGMFWGLTIALFYFNVNRMLGREELFRFEDF